MHENFYHSVKVYYEDTDAGGVVYYANYLKYLERARTEALTTIGLSNLQIKEKFGALIIVKSCNIEYKKSAHLEDQLIIRSFVKSVTKTSFFMNGPNKIELLEATNPESPIAKFIEKKGEGIHHIAFEVDDIEKEVKRLVNEGFVVLNEIPKKGADNKLVVFLHPKTTNGVLIELCQEII